MLTSFTIGITESGEFCPETHEDSVQTCKISFPLDIPKETVFGILCGMMELVDLGSSDLLDVPFLEDLRSLNRWFFDVPLSQISEEVFEGCKYLVNFPTMEEFGVIVAVENIENFLSGLAGFQLAAFLFFREILDIERFSLSPASWRNLSYLDLEKCEGWNAYEEPSELFDDLGQPFEKCDEEGDCIWVMEHTCISVTIEKN